MTPIERALSQSLTGKRELHRQDLIVSVTEQIWAALEAAQMNKADLARALETSKANVTQLLNGERNMTLATLADIAAALQLSPAISLASPQHRAITIAERMKDISTHVAAQRMEITRTATAGSGTGSFAKYQPAAKRVVSDITPLSHPATVCF